MAIARLTTIWTRKLAAARPLLRRREAQRPTSASPSAALLLRDVGEGQVWIGAPPDPRELEARLYRQPTSRAALRTNGVTCTASPWGFHFSKAGDRRTRGSSDTLHAYRSSPGASL